MATRQNRSSGKRGRAGFTLLEVTLASAIALLLLGALYVAVEIQVNTTASGRDAVANGALFRSLVARMNDDIKSSAGLSDAARWRLGNGSSSGSDASGGAGGGAGGAGGGAGGGAPMGNASTSQATATTNTSTSPYNNSTTSVAPNPNTVGIPLGVQGDSSHLILYVKKVPREALVNPGSYNAATAGGSPPSGLTTNGSGGNSTTSLPMNNSTTNGVPVAIVGDIRCVTYWLAGGDGAPLGLARMVINLPTSDDTTTLLPANVDNESAYVIAEEVRSLSFQYWDGTQWNDSWDSSTLGADGITPVGSPVAVAVNIGLAKGEGPDAEVKNYRQVIFLPTANGTTPQPSSTSSTTPGGGS
jgi:prepilin-type N-terminal cleavage/methylation domain-containing protein